MSSTAERRSLAIVSVPKWGGSPQALLDEAFPIKPEEHPEEPFCKDKDDKPLQSALGVSDLAVTESGDLLVLASFEADAAGRCTLGAGKPDTKVKLLKAYPPRRRLDDNDRTYARHQGDRIAEVQGALWRVPSTWLGGKSERPKDAAPRLVMRFAHKPEGIALMGLDEESALVVFDDDARRKGVERTPDTFAVKQDESVFVRIKLKAR